MSTALVCNVTGGETRVALVEDGTAVEIHVERPGQLASVGSIYLGKVVRVLPGMQAAFVDIGTDRAAFLYVAEVLNENDPDVSSSLSRPSDGAPVDDAAGGDSGRRGHASTTSRRIEEQLTEGQEVLVQVTKEPIGSKGARLTGHVSLPGRYLVFMPTVDHVGISRRIRSEAERARLRDLVESFRPPGSGVIIRTAAEGQPGEHLRRDLELLLASWAEVREARRRKRAPACLRQEIDLVLRTTRDLISSHDARIVVDDPATEARVREFFARFMPDRSCSVELYTGAEPIFSALGVEAELERALQRKVWLGSGAYLVFDETEALTAIDVNTGRYVGETDLEETITKINLEAVQAIVSQLRLRNIGGLIIIDLIDMESPSNRAHVSETLMAAIEHDRARTNLGKISDFGLVEMTRKRVQEGLVQYLFEPCSACQGRGLVKSPATVGYEILRALRSQLDRWAGVGVRVRAHADVERFLMEFERDTLAALKTRLGAGIRFASDGHADGQTFDLTVDVDG